MRKQKSQIDIAAILQALSQFDEVKHHLFAAGVELFRAFSKFITLLMEQLHNLNEKGGLDVVNNIKSIIETVLPWSAEGRAQEIAANKRDEILRSIIAVLNLEMKKVEGSINERDLMKYEVLASIRGVIIKELKKYRRQRRNQGMNGSKRSEYEAGQTRPTEPQIKKVCIE